MRVRRAHLVVTELLAERGQQVAQLRGGDESVAVLVEVAQALDEVVGRVAAARLRDRLPHNTRRHRRSNYHPAPRTRAASQ